MRLYRGNMSEQPPAQTPSAPVPDPSPGPAHAPDPASPRASSPAGGAVAAESAHAPEQGAGPLAAVASASHNTASAAPALAMRGLVKEFDGKVVVQGIDLEVPRGSFYAIVGPNGAGKTTALSMATGLLTPTSGTAEILGTDVWAHPNEAKSKVGVLADGLPTFDRLTGRELLTYVGLIRGMEAGVVKERTDSLLNTLGLADAEGKLVTDYSAGMTKKILLACALIHAPRLLVLDEPLEAVDPVSAQGIRHFLTQYVNAGGTVVISSHVMELVEGLCTHVAIIADGVVRAHGTLDEVRAGGSLTDRFIELAGGPSVEGDLSWLNQ